MNDHILEMRNIHKSFAGVQALCAVNFQISKGEIHCLVGENGAGKSTLMKVLSGVYPYGSYQGEIVFEGAVQEFHRIRDSVEAGIAIIYQELALFPDLSIHENIFVGNEIRKGVFVNLNETIIEAKRILEKVKLKINPETRIKELGVGKRQLVEIAKALSKNVKLLILDEPTAALNEDDSENLLHLLRELKLQGITCIMISHKLKEVISIADKVTVIRDGQTVCTLDAASGQINENVIIQHMVGREIKDIYPKREIHTWGSKILELRNWSAYDMNSGRQVLSHIHLHVRQGEIVGIAGLMGSGRTELAKSIFGNSASYKLEGHMLVEGKLCSFTHSSQAIAAGIAYVTEDRKGDGLFLKQNIKNNISIANLKQVSSFGMIDEQEEVKIAEKYKTTLTIKAPTIEQFVGNLSGGNQQKVSLGKWLFVAPKLLILDEPTRGIDVGAKFEIYTIMNRFIAEGMSIIMISSELNEVLGMSDRIYVMAEGQIKGELMIGEANQEKIMQLATL